MRVLINHMSVGSLQQYIMRVRIDKTFHVSRFIFSLNDAVVLPSAHSNRKEMPLISERSDH